MSVPGDTLGNLGRSDYPRSTGGIAPAASSQFAASTASSSAVSWGAIFAGAAAAAALSMILLVLGVGLGLSSVSPWSQSGIGSTALGFSTIVWITVTQLLASGMGGYLAGRLRTRWSGVHTDEVYFRDTAHGFLAWAVASLVTAAVLSSAIGSIVGKGVDAGASVASGAMATAATAATAGAGVAAAKGGDADQGSGPAAYFMDRLFRRETAAAPAPSAPASAAPTAPGADATAPGAASATGAATVVASAPAGGATNAGSEGAGASSTATSTAEVTRIFVRSLRSGNLPPEEARYVGQLVAQRTGLSQADAEKRVTDTFGRMQAEARDAETAAREAADKARKASAYGALWLFISLMSGAFIASLMATYGGRQRDL